MTTKPTGTPHTPTAPPPAPSVSMDFNSKLLAANTTVTSLPSHAPPTEAPPLPPLPQAQPELAMVTPELVPPNSISELSDTSQLKLPKPSTPPVPPSTLPTPLKSANTTLPRAPGMPTLPSLPRTPRLMPSPPSSAHQRPQPSHHFQPAQGPQLPPLATLSKAQREPPSG